jgi:hypothetical protein
LNSQNPSIKFTCEEEVDGSLLFLDVPTLSVASLSRQVISINTKWMPRHVAPGLCNLPFSRENFEKEVAYIKETAGLNGTIDGLLSKHLFKCKIKEVATLSPINKVVTTKRAGLTFQLDLSSKISNTSWHIARHPNGS